MTSQLLLREGVELMFYGMGLVFLFLVLLIFCIQLLAKLFERFAVHEVSNQTAAQRGAKPVSSVPIDKDTLSAIQIAIQQHRAQQH